MFAAFLAAAMAAATPAPASPTLAVTVTPEDPTVRFQGNGSSIKFDPACRDFTLSTVGSDPACAARVQQRELAPAFAIAIQTLMREPARQADAVAVLDELATKTNHPAVHYLLGNHWATGQQTAPDYPRAVRHLEAAVKGGNPVAKDLLASLLIAGKGTSRDVPRAIALYEQAAASGFPTSGTNLGLLYLHGRDLPRDQARGGAWIKAAAAAGDQTATAAEPMLAIDEKAQNFQLMPSADPAKVRMVRYGTFENPEIPPGFGFDTDFQAVYRAPYSDPQLLARLTRDAATLPTPYLYELARRQAGTDPALAIRTYLTARTRMAYDVARCSDPQTAGALRAWDGLMVPQLTFLFNPANFTKAAIADALKAEAALPAGSEPWWVCRGGMGSMTAAMEGRAEPLPLKPQADWPALREAARAGTAKLVP